MDNTVEEKQQLKANFHETIKNIIEEKRLAKENAVDSELVDSVENGEIKLVEPEPVKINRRPENYYIKKQKNKQNKKQQRTSRRKNRK